MPRARRSARRRRALRPLTQLNPIPGMVRKVDRDVEAFLGVSTHQLSGWYGFARHGEHEVRAGQVIQLPFHPPETRGRPIVRLAPEIDARDGR